jgi:hypothetical protein
VILNQTEFGPEIIPYLQRAGIRYLDFMNLDLDHLTENRAKFVGDGHPTSYTHAALADAIVRALPTLALHERH